MSALSKELIDALDPFVRVAQILKPLDLPSEQPLIEALPGAWPTVGDLMRLREAAIKAARAPQQ